MDIDLSLPPHLQDISHPLLEKHRIRLKVMRLDAIHPVLSGNKYFKLKENLLAAQRDNYRSVLTFGGAYSNHLIATAAAARYSGLQSIGIVRGWQGAAHSTATLQACEAQHMQLHFVSREDYRRKEDDDYLQQLARHFRNPYIIPEGGNNTHGRNGAGEIADFIPEHTQLVTIPVGTGTTLAGVCNRLPASRQLLGFCAMKNGEYLAEAIMPGIKSGSADWQLITGYHFGGFAKHDATLIRFMNEMYTLQQLPLDKVYTAKMLYGIFDMVHTRQIEPGTSITAIHTGGLQGNVSIQDLLCY